MSKPNTLTAREAVNLIMIYITKLLPQAQPGSQAKIVDDVTGELQALPIVRPTQAKRHRKSA